MASHADDTLTAADAARLLEGTTPGPWEVDSVSICAPPHGCTDIVKGGRSYGCHCCCQGEDWGVEHPADAPLLAAAPDLARAVVRRERERDEARRLLGECYIATGEDTDGNPPESPHIWPHAVQAVRALRGEYDEACAEVARLTKNATAREGVLRREGDLLRKAQRERDEARAQVDAARKEERARVVAFLRRYPAPFMDSGHAALCIERGEHEGVSDGE